MWMHLAMACINHKPLEIRLINQSFKKPLPYTPIAPANKSSMGVAPAAKVRREIPPRRTGTHDPKNCIYEAPIVMSYATPRAFAPRQKWFKFFPNIIRNVVSSMCYWRHGFLACIEDKRSMPQD
jgi:hypothetical protein